MVNFSDLWNHFIQAKAFWFATYSIVVTIIMAAIIYKHHIKRRKYNKWKDTISIPGIWKREYEPHHDEMFEKLWDENEQHKEEIKILKKVVERLNRKMFIIGIVVYLLYGLKYYFWHRTIKRKKKNLPKVEPPFIKNAGKLQPQSEDSEFFDMALKASKEYKPNDNY